MLRNSSKMFRRELSSFKKSVLENIELRNSQKIKPNILDKKQVIELCNILTEKKDEKNKEFYIDMFTNRISPEVDETSKIKASFLNNIFQEKIESPYINKLEAIQILGTMQGGYNIEPLIEILNNRDYGYHAAKALSQIIFIFDYYYDIDKMTCQGNIFAQMVMESWANAEWFFSNPSVPEKISLSVFKVPGETNTDDLSPYLDDWSTHDIPLHALSMLKNPRDGIIPDIPGEIGPIKTIEQLKKKGLPIAYVGDVVGTGSSKKSAANSIMWHFGNEIPNVPNKNVGGYCIGGKIDPIFFNTMEDNGALPVEMDVEKLNMGDMIDIYPYEGVTKEFNTNNTICNWNLKSKVILDSVRAGGRVNLIIGKTLTEKARNSFSVGLGKSTNYFRENPIHKKENSKI